MSTPRTGCLYPGTQNRYHCEGGWLGLGSSLVGCEKYSNRIVVTLVTTRIVIIMVDGVVVTTVTVED